MTKTSLLDSATARRGAGIGAVLLRYASGGGVCFAVNLGLLWLATEVWKWHYLAGLALSWIVVSGLGFFLHRRWTFRSRSVNIADEMRRYLSVNVAQTGCAFALMIILVSGLGLAPWLANVTASLFLMIGSFLLHRNWSFATNQS